MSKEFKYMLLIRKNRKDCTFTLAELAEWIEESEGITYSAARSKAGRLIKRLPCDVLSSTMFKLSLIPALPEKDNDPKKEVLIQDQFQMAKTIVAYLNQQAGTNYRGSAPDLAKIKARLNDGFTEMELRIVIDKKVREWKGTDLAKYLRVETLFGSKFEGYLNAKEGPKGKIEQMTQFDFEKYNT